MRRLEIGWDEYMSAWVEWLGKQSKKEKEADDERMS